MLMYILAKRLYISVLQYVLQKFMNLSGITPLMQIGAWFLQCGLINCLLACSTVILMHSNLRTNSINLSYSSSNITYVELVYLYTNMWVCIHMCDCICMFFTCVRRTVYVYMYVRRTLQICIFIDWHMCAKYN